MRCEICGRDLNAIWSDNMADGGREIKNEQI
jgi:hypothetical protein|nr:MAG TPA: zinc finger domain-containing protein [Caudoviricetes sp.]